MAEMVKHFTSDASALLYAFSTAADSRASSLAALREALSAWEQELAAGPREGPSGGAPPVLRAFLHSRALEATLEAMAESAHFGAALRAAAAALAEAPGAPAPGPEDGEEGELLARLLLKTSAAPPALLSELLELLAQAREAAEACRSGALEERGVAAEEVSKWVLRLVLAALTDWDEADALEVSRACGAVERALAAARASLSQHPADSYEKRPSLKKLPLGTEVWASWPVDGRWYRAHVKGSSRRRVQVSWLPPPGEAGSEGDADEYLAGEAGDGGAPFTELGRSAVVPISEAEGRPAPAPADGPPARHWAGPLAAVEAQDAHFRVLRGLCARVESLRRGGGPAAEPAEEGPPLRGAAGTLRAFRAEAEEHAEGLGCIAALAADEARGLREGLARCAGSAEAELRGLREEHPQAAAAVEAARERREGLLQQLRWADEELAAAEEALGALEAREQHLTGEGVQAAEELARRGQAAKEHSDMAMQRQSVLTRAAAASQQLEELLAARAAAVADAAALKESLSGQEQALRSTCVVSNRAQRRSLQGLLARWQEQVWGPEAAALAGSAEQLAELRRAHGRVLEVVDSALQAAEQAAQPERSRPGGAGVLESLFGLAESEDESDDDAVAERMSRAAPKYRRMRHQLSKNLERLAEMEARAGAPRAPEKGPAPSPPFSLAAEQLSCEEVVLFSGSPAA